MASQANVSRSSQAAKFGLLALLVAMLFFVFWAVLTPVFVSPRPFVSQSNGRMGVADFVIFYEAGVIARSPDHDRIYDPEVQLKYCNELIAPDKLTEPFYIQYPPWFFTVQVLISLLPIRAAFVVWTIIWPLIGSLCLYLNLRHSRIKAPLDQALFILFTVCSLPAVLGMKLGQTSWVYFTCVCLLCYGWRTGKNKIAGAALALSTIKLQYTLFLWLPVVARKRWRLLGWAAAFETLLLAVTAANVGWQNFVKYPAWLARIEGSGAIGVEPASFVSAQGLFYSFLPPKVSQLLSVALFAISFFYLVWMWMRTSKSDAFDRDDWPWAVTLALSIMAGLHVHRHDCINLAVAAALTLSSINIMQESKQPELPVKTWSLLMLFYPLVSWLVYSYHETSSWPLLAPLNMIVALSAVASLEKKLKSKEAPTP